MEVPRVGVQNSHLPPGSLHYAGVAVPHVGYIVVPVQVAAPAFIPEVLLPAAYDLDGFPVADA